MMKSPNPVVLVTGGAGGIGTAITESLLATGARVMVADRDAGPSQNASEGTREGHAQREYVQVDLASVVGARAAVEGTIERFGRIDALVNSAAIGVPSATADVTEAEWDLVFGTNLKGTFFVTQAAVDHMSRQRAGKVVNIASELAHTGHPTAMTYAASKAALLNLTRSLAQDLAPHVLVNAVCPGPTDTAMLRAGPDDVHELECSMPIRRLLTPADIAATVAFLLGPDGNAYTGQHLDPNGGIVMA